MCQLSSCICLSPIGRLAVSYCSKGLHTICQVSSINDSSFTPDKNQQIEIESKNGDVPMPESCFAWLHSYFHSPDALTSSPELCPTVIAIDDSFQRRVWRTLLDQVPFGQTITYGQLAELAGNQKAARAVGTAMRLNPFQLVVPCHRVIRSNGESGNYAGGVRNSVKCWLLKHEKS